MFNGPMAVAVAGAYLAKALADTSLLLVLVHRPIKIDMEPVVGVKRLLCAYDSTGAALFCRKLELLKILLGDKQLPPICRNIIESGTKPHTGNY
jgi:hypothetical protein